MNMHALLKNLEARWVKAGVSAANNTDSNTSRIDMANYEAAMFVTPITDSVATGVATLTVEHNDADSDSGMAAVSGAVATKTCAVNDDINNTLLIVEVVNPTKRYLQGVLTSATANIAFGESVVLLKPKLLPTGAAQGATVSASTSVAG